MAMEDYMWPAEQKSAVFAKNVFPMKMHWTAMVNLFAQFLLYKSRCWQFQLSNPVAPKLFIIRG